MADEINDIVEDVIPVPELPEVKEGEEDKTDYKAFAEKAREIAEQNRGIAQRNKTRAERFKANGGKPAEAIKPEAGKDNAGKSDELDYGQKAFLAASELKIKGTDEMELVKAELKKSGATLDELIENPYFLGKLDKLRSDKRADNASITGGKRTSNAAPDSIEYWIKKPLKADGTRDLPEDRKLRQQVVNALIDKEKNVDIFGPSPK